MSRDIRKSYNIRDEDMQVIYDDILQNPIVLADDEIIKLKYFTLVRNIEFYQNSEESALAKSVKKKQTMFLKESNYLIKKGKELIKQKKTSTFVEVTNTEPVRAMFEVWNFIIK
jgi:hypothetical protein